MTGKRLIVDRNTLGDLLGVRADHVTRLVSQGMPVLRVGTGRGNKTTFNAVKALAWMREKQEAANGAGKSVRDEYFQALTEKVLQETAARAGELVSIDQVILAGQMQTKAWVARLRALPRRLVTSGAIQAEKERAVADIIRELQIEISEWRPTEGAKAQKGRR